MSKNVLNRSLANTEINLEQTMFLVRDKYLYTMIQSIIVAIIFIGAVAYVARLIYKSFESKSCATGCGKCGAVDFNKIEKQLKEKGL